MLCGGTEYTIYRLLYCFRSSSQSFNFFSCVIGKATIIVNIPEVLCWILKLFLGDSADVGYTVDDSHHIRIDIQFHDDKTLFLETGEKEGKVKKKDGK